MKKSLAASSFPGDLIPFGKIPVFPQVTGDISFSGITNICINSNPNSSFRILIMPCILPWHTLPLPRDTDDEAQLRILVTLAVWRIGSARSPVQSSGHRSSRRRNYKNIHIFRIILQMKTSSFARSDRVLLCTSSEGSRSSHKGASRSSAPGLPDGHLSVVRISQGMPTYHRDRPSPDNQKSSS